MTRTKGVGRFLGCVLVWSVLAVTPGGARAEDPIDRVSLTGQVGASSVSMGAINDRIDLGNRTFLEPNNYKTLDDIRYGFNFTYDLRARVWGPVAVSLGGGRTVAKSSLDFDQVISIKPTADFQHLRVYYDLPFRPTSNLILRVGGGPVRISSAKVKVTHESRTTEGGTERVDVATFEGKGWGAHAFLESEMVLSEKITFIADLGYRRAKVSQDSWSWDVPEYNGSPGEGDDGIRNDLQMIYNNSFILHSFLDEPLGEDGLPLSDPVTGRAVYGVHGGKVDLDFSGVLLNVGLRFYLF